MINPEIITIVVVQRRRLAKFTFVVKNPIKMRIGSVPKVLVMLSVAKYALASFSASIIQGSKLP
jgi:hypothetical protein